MIGFSLFSCAATGAILSTVLVTMMVGEVNRKLPDLEQFKYFARNLSRLKKRYKELYPEGRLVLALKIVTILVPILILSAVVAFGFFG